MLNCRRFDKVENKVKLLHFQICCEFRLVHYHWIIICTWKSKSFPLTFIALPTKLLLLFTLLTFPLLKVCWCPIFPPHTRWHRWSAALGPCKLLATFVILMFYLILYFWSCLALSSSCHFACAIQRYHILPVTRRLHLPFPHAPPPSQLSLWQPRAAQSPHKMPTKRAGTRAEDCGPRTALAVPSTARRTAWTAPKRSWWP